MAVVVKSDSGDSGTPVDATGGLAGFNMHDLASEGRRQVEDCRLQAEQILAQAKSDAEQIRHDAEQRGYEDGVQRGLSDAEVRIQESAEQRASTGLDLVRSAVDQMYDAHEQWMNQYALRLGEVAIAAAGRIVTEQLRQNPELIVQWAHDAVRSTRAASELTVAVHPETLAQLGQALDEMLAAPDLPENTRVIPDDTVGRTEVAVRQSGGEIKAGLEAQLRRLEELFA